MEIKYSGEGECNTCGVEDVPVYFHKYNKSNYEDCLDCTMYHKEVWEEQQDADHEKWINESEHRF